MNILNNFDNYVLEILSVFPDDIIGLDISNYGIEGSIDFSRFTKIEKLNCCYNQITSLDNLPRTLSYER